jgi:hypothetical protein
MVFFQDLTKALSAVTILLLLISGCTHTQKVLLVGTQHVTSKERAHEVKPIMEALKRFDPDIICGEFVVPTDTASLVARSDRGGEEIFGMADLWRKEWNVSQDNDRAIKSLQSSLERDPHDLRKRMELAQHYLLSHDQGNADFQSHIVFKKLEGNTAMDEEISKSFKSYSTFRKHYQHEQARNNEYQILVFPLAIHLNISYIFPIDDFSTWKLYEKHYDRLQMRDDTDSLKVKYHQRKADFIKLISSIPKETNLWLTNNSPSFTKFLVPFESYTPGPYGLHEDIKMISEYWILRNRTMAQHIDEVARKHPNKNLVVFFGASHTAPVEIELNKLRKKYQVLTLKDIMDLPDPIEFESQMPR